MIEAEKLTKYYEKVAAIENVSFTVENGEIVGFLGPNGAGKTTTMRILTGFLPPSSGTARVAGYDILTDSLHVRRRIGYLPENVPLYTDMKVANYLEFVAEVKGVERRKRRRMIGEIMEKCRVTDVQRMLIGALSRGYRQRVGIAQALLNDPEVLILDEPTVGLDPKQIIEIRQLIKSLAGDHTVILSSHILPEVEQTCGRVVIINRGRIVAVDTPEKLSMSLRGANLYAISVRRPSEDFAVKLAALDGVVHVELQGNEGTFVVESSKDRDIREELAEWIVQQKVGLLELRPVAFTLEDVFVQLTTAEKGVTAPTAKPDEDTIPQ